MRISDWSSDVCSSDLKPLLGRWRWFAVTLCTTIATGILFWGVAEPLFHLNEPPKMLGLKPGSDAAATFAMSTMFLHWTLTPYAIYTVAALAFAIVYYNRREPFRLDRKSTRRTPVTHANLVCRIPLEKKNKRLLFHTQNKKRQQ